MRILKKESQENDIYRKDSYSQCGEDLIIKVIFDNLKMQNPSYIDIGAHHPYKISNTAIFYKQGSRGINIEPNKILFKEFVKQRPEDINLNIGISEKKGEIDFYIINDPALSTFSFEEANKYKEEGNYWIETIEKVSTLPIGEVINKYSPSKFPDLLSIDAEGVDEIIIKSIDYDNNFPTVICVETISFSMNGRGIKNTDLIEFIKAKGYLLFADTYLNSIFVREKIWRR